MHKKIKHHIIPRNQEKHTYIRKDIHIDVNTKMNHVSENFKAVVKKKCFIERLRIILKQIENLSKETEVIKKYQMKTIQLKYIVSKVKNVLKLRTRSILYLI